MGEYSGQTYDEMMTCGRSFSGKAANQAASSFAWSRPCADKGGSRGVPVGDLPVQS